MLIARPLLTLGLTSLLLLPAGAATAQRGNMAIELVPATVTFPAPTMADFDTGWVDHPGVTIAVTSRPPSASWEIRMQAAEPDLGGYGKPLSHLLWRQEGASEWTALSELDTVLVQAAGDADVTLHFRLLLDWDADRPGTYSTGLTFSAYRL